MELINNTINIEMWNEILQAVNKSKEQTNQKDDVLYAGEDKRKENKHFYCYDNYDRLSSPGLDFVTNGDSDQGNLYVYNASEMDRAPITFKQGLQIALNFFNAEGSMMAEEIVCEYVMDNGKGASIIV